MSTSTVSPAALPPASPGTAQPVRLTRVRLWPLALALTATSCAALAVLVAVAIP